MAIKRMLITRFPYESTLSGEEWHSLKLAERLKEQDYQVEFLGSCPVLLKEFARRKMPTHSRWGGTPPVTKWAALKMLLLFPLLQLSFLRIARWACQQPFDVVYMHSLPEKLFLTPKLVKRGIQVVWVEHAALGRWLFKNPFFRRYRRLSRQVQIISVSQKSETELKEKGVQNVHYIMNGIDLSEFSILSQKDKQTWRKEHKLSGEAPLIGSITRMWPDKGVPDFLKALHLSGQSGVIVGQGPKLASYQQLAKNLGAQVHFIPKLDRAGINAFLNAIDVFVLPSSQHDPFGLVVAEALSVKKPSIVTDVCGILTHLKAGKELVVVPAQNPTALAQAIQDLLQEPQKTQAMAEAGCLAAHRQFDLKRMVEDYKRVFNLKP